ncbi:MAG: alcohol dehydrogenase, partial [Thermoplasmata archaeon]
MKAFHLKYGGTELHFGVNAIKNLEKRLSKIEHATIVTGKQSARRSGAL